ncbi:uncharacterized protein ATNIH1004_005759 [Aspergillus tanneri]|uniref:Uncharacterized protein n=1 Tax=Aspergillus tanneri TaxID=1220188 RepID=A0A5M9MMF1_9EURO|nr:uncharacterized protein ATNIH1004_005759 [Aspergillus tanneri]KAA8647076.1 hypothetical protein ATNIH1004_005759 [Aspergillus tanneri]
MFPRWTLPYQRVHTDDSTTSPSSDEKHTRDVDGLAESQPDNPQRSRYLAPLFRNIAYAAVAICIFTMLISLGLYGVLTQKDRKSKNSPSRPCGNSSSEAMSLGCTFDHLTWSWYPPNCPHYANDEFIHAEHWKYYFDPQGRREAVGKEFYKALDTGVDLYTERREHTSHCVFLFLSLGQIIRDATPYPPILVQYEHVLHCSEMVLKALRRDEDWHKIDTHVGNVSYDVVC